MSKLLVADDEPRVVRLLSRCLVADGHTVVTASDGLEALQALREHDIELVLLDVVMPRCNGLQFLTELGKLEAPPPVIVLSAVNEVRARVLALDRGAVDFVQKPFHTAELLARVRRHLLPVPRQRAGSEDRYLAAGGLEVDLERRRVRGEGGEVVLSEREFGLLVHLMRQQGDVCRKEDLLRDLWGADSDPGSNVVEVCVRRVRAKLGRPPIETVRGVGYCFTGQ